uniref:Uncharacterized protein n=1 Tax=viral metagenome TaxID=1070528 RepID=A0A6C0K4G1_9ZZZZ
MSGQPPLAEKIYKILNEIPMTFTKLETILRKWELNIQQIHCIQDIFDEVVEISNRPVYAPALALFHNPEVQKIYIPSKHGKHSCYIQPKNCRGMIDIHAETDKKIDLGEGGYPLPVVAQYWISKKEPKKQGYTNLIEFYDRLNGLLDEIHIRDWEWESIKPFLVPLTTKRRDEIKKGCVEDWLHHYPGRLTANSKKRIEEIIDGQWAEA